MSDPEGGPAHLRRRSVDVGGLALALGNSGLGHGWGGWEEHDMGETRYAELLSDMYTQTQETVNHHQASFEYASMPIEISPSTRQRLIESLDSWNFEPHKLPEDEVFCCTQILFETLFRVVGMQDAIGLPLGQISQFIRHLRTIYRVQNSYHNFQHALDVLQATQTFLCAAGKVPPVAILASDDDNRRMFFPDKREGRDDELISSLDNLDLFTLYIAAIGHDVGHPGFTNAFMKNAKTPLSLVYNDTSALEQMHYILLLQIMHHNGLGDLIDRHDDSGVRFRKLLSDVVLATDMSVHGEFMRRFRELVEGKVRQGKEREAVRVTLMCQALIKCADISNPSRPHGVSQHWASALSAEWTSQVQLEAHFRLPCTLNPSKNPLAEANSQIFFITNFAKPLLDLTARAIPQMIRFAEQCTQNLKTWDARSKELRATTSAPPETLQTETSYPSSLSIPEVFLSAFPLTLPVHWVGRPTKDTRTTLSGSESLNPISTDAPTSSPPHTDSPSIPALFSSNSMLTSPAESAGSLLSPRLDIPSTPSTHPYQLSSAISATSNSDATNAMRAAYHASVRKKRSIQNRNSWNTSPLGSGSFYSPPPLPPTPAQGLGPTVALDIPLVKDSKASFVLPDSSLKPNDSITSSNFLLDTDTISPPTTTTSDSQTTKNDHRSHAQTSPSCI